MARVMRINKPWKINKWLPVFLAMPRMLKELDGHPESGFLGHIMSLAGEYETVYSGVPPTGLGKVGQLVPASGARESASGRFRK